MAWTSRITALLDPPVPTDSRALVAEFSAPGRASITKEFKIRAGLSADDVTSFLAGECARLDQLDGAVADLAQMIGAEITLAPPNPGVVKMWQARAVLREHGYFATVDAAIMASGNAAMQEAWEYAPDISRGSPLVASMAAVLGLSPEQVDGLFAEAARLAV